MKQYILNILFGFIFLLCIFLYFPEFYKLDIHINVSPLHYFLCAIFFLINHLLRWLRLYLISGPAALTARSLFSLHFTSSSFGIVLPFRLGDLYRLGALSSKLQSVSQAIFCLGSEKIIDLGLILCSSFILFYFFNDGGLQEFITEPVKLFFISMIFFVPTIILLSFKQLLLLIDIISTKKINSKTVSSSLNIFRNFLKDIYPTYNNLKSFRGLIILLTIFIWFFEGLALLIIVPGLTIFSVTLL